MHFVLDPRDVRLQLVAGEGHHDAVVEPVRQARTSVWIATANLKELWLEERGAGRRPGRRDDYRSSLELFDSLAARGVELRVLHARLPSQRFRDAFDRMPRLVQGGLELRQCPRVHLKLVVVDGALLYLGSANWTGAGIGARGAMRRNFELGITTADAALLDAAQALFDSIWRGRGCAGCKLRDDCEAPLDLG